MKSGHAKVLGFFALVMVMTAFSSAASCLVVTSTDITGYIAEIPKISSQLSTCTVQIQGSVHSLVGDGNILVTVGSNQFYGTITNQQLTAITAGTPTSYTYEVSMNEATFNGLLASSDVFNDILRGIKNKDIKIKASSFWGQIKWFFASWFLPNPSSPPAGTPTTGAHLPQGVTGKPDNCDDTYLPGHQGYAQNKDAWDEYSRNTDKVCQSVYGRGAPSPCIHTVQLSVSGNPYYLCWYNE